MRSLSLATECGDGSRSEGVSSSRHIGALLHQRDSGKSLAGSLNEERRPVNSPMRSAIRDSSSARSRSCTIADMAMERYARGDEAAFAEVYDAVAPRLHAYLVRQTRDRSLADDLLQQALLQIHRKRGTYINGCSVLPWAFAIARRLYIDALRHRKWDALSSARTVADEDREAHGAPDDEIMTRETVLLVEAELSRMPETQRAAFELLRVDGLSHDEAAQVLGTTVNAVKLRAFRAYAALRAALERALDRPNMVGPAPTKERPRAESQGYDE